MKIFLALTLSWEKRIPTLNRLLDYLYLHITLRLSKSPNCTREILCVPNRLENEAEKLEASW